MIVNAGVPRWFLKSCPRCSGDVLYRLQELRCVTGCGWNGPTRENVPAEPNRRMHYDGPKANRRKYDFDYSYEPGRRGEKRWRERDMRPGNEKRFYGAAGRGRL